MREGCAQARLPASRGPTQAWSPEILLLWGPRPTLRSTRCPQAEGRAQTGLKAQRLSWSVPEQLSTGGGGFSCDLGDPERSQGHCQITIGLAPIRRGAPGSAAGMAEGGTGSLLLTQEPPTPETEPQLLANPPGPDHPLGSGRQLPGRPELAVLPVRLCLLLGPARLQAPVLVPLCPRARTPKPGSSLRALGMWGTPGGAGQAPGGDPCPRHHTLAPGQSVALPLLARASMAPRTGPGWACVGPPQPSEALGVLVCNLEP